MTKKCKDQKLQINSWCVEEEAQSTDSHVTPRFIFWQVPQCAIQPFSTYLCNHLDGEEKVGCFALFDFMLSLDCCVTLLRGATGLSAICDCGTS